MKTVEIIIDTAYDGKPVKTVLKHRLKISAAILTSLKKHSDGILVNGTKAMANTIVHMGDTITINIHDTSSPNIEPCRMELDILQEDEDILVLNKPRSMPTHPSQNHHSDTLANGVMHYYRHSDFTFRVITRLDRDTSGVVLIAKNLLSASLLSEQMRRQAIHKEYIALCHGTPQNASGTIDAPIARVEGSTILRCVSPNGKKSITHYSVVSTHGNLSLINLNPQTGRTHQLRVHLAHIGHPIYGDDMYGSPVIGDRTRLHCRAITFTSPASGETITVEAPIPSDIAELIK
ncbi:MAG: RluA family pseudouridine synthase [Clostridia bacterium]|nr:RluA family pseudouridine synthase [Clostridia bacterium]